MTQIRKYSIALIVTAAIIIELIGAAQYFLAQRGARNEALAKAGRDMVESQRVAKVKTEVETAINNAVQDVRQSLNNPDNCYRIGARIINVNSHIVGVGVAFVPNYYPDRGRDGLFMPYTYDDDPDISYKGKRTLQPHIQTNVPDMDYTERDWYKSAIAGQRQWCEPYLGEGGINILMCTYSVPVEDSKGRIVAVFCADVTMEDATVLMNRMHSGIRKSSIVILAIQLISLLLMVFIIWRAVQASQRYKEQHVDPEKEHLADQVIKLKEVNGRLTKRNQELAEKVADLQRRLAAGPQVSDQHWFG